ncbi:hypothetical protein Leryth_020085 [Lithospermum erythrorhizon]|nr:hypothetical protein Leryth_020085 [Lithospermum erythrorhizon]
MKSRRLPPFATKIITILTAKHKPLQNPKSNPRIILLHNSKEHNQTLITNNKTLNNLVKSGCLSSAIHLFDEMPHKDVITWNIMISGNNFYGFQQKALYLYTQMVYDGILENCSTFSIILSSCNNAGFYKGGLEVHCRVIVQGFSRNIYICSALIDLYMKMGCWDVATKLFYGLKERTLATWNLVFRGLCENGRSGEMLRWFSYMIMEDVEPNALTYCYLIRGCGHERLLDGGKQFHSRVIKKGWLVSNIFVANSLVDFYSACGSLVDCERSFDVIEPENVTSWNSMVFGYAANGLLLDALQICRRMHYWGKKPSARSYAGLLNLSSRMNYLIVGTQIHCCVLKQGFDMDSVLLQSALIDMYGKCGDIAASVCLFDNLPERTLESCNSLMTSLLHCGVIEDVIELFGLMVDESIGYDAVTLSSTIKALSTTASASSTGCTLLHCCSIKLGFGADIAVSCSLVDAYSKCGKVDVSCQIFGGLHSPNVICFTSIINAYARNGLGAKCLEMLNVMIQKGLKPDKVAFLCVLIGCNHSGMIKEARLVFNSMRTDFGLDPEKQHFSCMVDLLCRAGLVDEAEELLQYPPVTDDPVMWSSLLRSCRILQNDNVGRRVAVKLMDLEPDDPAAWLQISTFYSEIGDFETSAHIQDIAVARKIGKDIGFSLVEV